MRRLRKYRLWEIRRPYGVAVRIGLLTAGAILLFAMVNTLVIYRYMKLDFYLCLVAVFFLVLGFWMNRRKGENFPRGKDEALPDELRSEEVPVAASPITRGEAIALLSAKEWQILKLVAEGRTNKEIAAAQFVEVSTVKTHLNNIIRQTFC